jgi:hypothetical protein
MKELSYEEFVVKYKKYYNLVSGVLEDKSYKNLFIRCRLKPYDAVFGKLNTSKNYLITHWVDEFNNSLFIKDKKISIVYNDLSIDRSKIKTSDLYFKLPLHKIYTISDVAYIGKANDYYCFLFKSNDIYRYYYYKDELIQLSPLCLGFKALKEFYKHENIKLYTKPRTNFNLYWGDKITGIITSLPMKIDLFNLNKNIFNNLI